MKKLLIISFFILSCSTKEKQETTESIKTDFYEAKIQIKDLVKNKNNFVSAEFHSIKNQNLRADFTATMGIDLATLVVDRKDFTLLVHNQKKAYAGKSNDQSLKPVLGFNLDPKILFYLIYDLPLSGQNWNCELDTSSAPQVCQNKNSDLKVVWSEKNGPQKRVTITKSGFEMQIFFKNYTTKVQENKNLYSISIPETYKKYQLD
jgi:hypothetical protein